MMEYIDNTQAGVRFVSMIDGHKKYPPTERNPDLVTIIGYDDLMDVIRELSGSAMGRGFADKLERAVRADVLQRLSDFLYTSEAPESESEPSE